MTTQQKTEYASRESCSHQCRVSPKQVHGVHKVGELFLEILEAQTQPTDQQIQILLTCSLTAADASLWGIRFLDQRLEIQEAKVLQK